MNIGQELRAIRTKLRLSLMEVEAKYGHNAVRVGSYERGDRHGSFDAIQQLIHDYGYSLAVLAPGDVVCRDAWNHKVHTVKYWVEIPGVTEFECSGKAEAEAVAAAVSFASIGTQIIGPVQYETKTP